MLLLLNLLKIYLNLILSKKLVLLETKFNENFSASQKTWKKGKTWQMAMLPVSHRCDIYVCKRNHQVRNEKQY